MKLSRHSHKIVTKECDYKISTKCIGSITTQHRNIEDNKERNNGKYVCFYCSRQSKYTGRGNPNVKYKNINDNMFSQIDTKEKAYLLGWIISDGHNRLNQSGFTITIKEEDRSTLSLLKNIVDPNLTLKRTSNHMVSLTVNSKTISKDLEKLGVPIGKKSNIVSLPTITKDLQFDLIRGIFDGDGTITNPENSKRLYLTAKITSSSKILLEQIRDIIDIPCSIYGGDCFYLEYSCNNALDFLGKIYENSEGLHLTRKYNLYRLWTQYVPSIQGRNVSLDFGKMKCFKTNKDAVLPSKNRVSDSGYDLTAISLIKRVGDIYYYGTGIKVVPDFGWALDIRARSSISKSGYILANGVGTIDRTYLGEIIIPMRKVAHSMPDFELPAKIAQLVPRPIHHLEIQEVFSEDDLGETNRGDKGFGSSDNV